MCAVFMSWSNHNCPCCCIYLWLRLSQKLVGQWIGQTDHSVVTTVLIKGVSIVDYGVTVAGPSSSAPVHSPLDLIGSSILFQRVHLSLVPLASTATCPWRRQFLRQWCLSRRETLASDCLPAEPSWFMFCFFVTAMWASKPPIIDTWT